MKDADKSDSPASLATTVAVLAHSDRKVRRRSMIAADFTLTDAEHIYAVDHGWTHSFIEAQLEKFKNHHMAKGSTMADWSAAWRKWVGNDYDRLQSSSGPQRTASRPPSRVDSAIEGMFSDLTEEDFRGRTR